MVGVNSASLEVTGSSEVVAPYGGGTRVSAKALTRVDTRDTLVIGSSE